MGDPGDLDEAARQRLTVYCRRSIYSRGEVARQGLRDVRVLNADLRRLIWRDVEVRDALLEAADDRVAWDALCEQVDVDLALPLLDLVSAASLERSRVEKTTKTSTSIYDTTNWRGRDGRVISE